MPGPLDGVRIIDLTTMISGPMATMILADQGAEVVKIEAKGAGDMMRYLGPQRGGMTAMFASCNRNKKSLILDLKSAAGAEVLWRLVDRADALVQNFRPGALHRLGFGADALLARNPRLVYCAITGFGEDGPYADRRVYDPIIQAVSGFAASQADPKDGKPQLIRSLVCDKTAALTAAQALTAALYARDKTGQGQRLSISMLDAAIAFLWPEVMYNQVFTGADAPAPSPEWGDTYALRELKGGQVTLSALTDQEFRALAATLGAPELGQDPRFATLAARQQHRAEMAGILAPLFEAIDADTLIARAAIEGAPAAKALSRADVLADPQVRHNAVVVEDRHPEGGAMRGARHAARFSETPADARAPAPPPGRDTADILSALGYSVSDISALRAAGSVA